LHVEYLRETELGLPIQIEKSYAMTPNQRFLVVRYTLTNNILPEDNRSVRVRFTEVVDVNNKAALNQEKSADDLAGTGLNEPNLDQPIKDIKAQVASGAERLDRRHERLERDVPRLRRLPGYGPAPSVRDGIRSSRIRPRRRAGDEDR
jgi:hypothetical protein